jgi:hypothetical protein
MGRVSRIDYSVFQFTGIEGVGLAIGMGKNGHEQENRLRDFLMGLTGQSRGVNFCAILSYILIVLNEIWIVFLNLSIQMISIKILILAKTD